jgi:2,3-bisphosphoglycerate-dependent phosphoglycerate mutase
LICLYFVRHAHADWTPDENRPLSAQGAEDAIRIAELLQEYPIRAIYTSPYRRAQQTVEPLAERLDLPLSIEPDLRERSLGSGPFEDFFQAIASVWQDPSFAHPGGESNKAAQKRGVFVIQRLKRQHHGDHVVVSTHGNLMALMLQHYQPALDFEFWQSLTMPDVYLLSFDSSDQVVLERVWS